MTCTFSIKNAYPNYKNDKGNILQKKENELGIRKSIVPSYLKKYLGPYSVSGTRLGNR